MIDPDLKSSASQTLAGFDAGMQNGNHETTHRFSCSIYLCKIKITSQSVRSPMRIFLRYQYPFFGSAAPVITRPAVEVLPKVEAQLGNITHFTFGATEDQLLRAFRA